MYRYFVYYMGKDRLRSECFGNCEYTLDQPIDYKQIKEIEKDICKENELVMCLVQNYQKFEV